MIEYHNSGAAEKLPSGIGHLEVGGRADCRVTTGTVAKMTEVTT